MSFFGNTTALGATSTPAKPGGLFSSSSFSGSSAPAAPTFGAPTAFGTAGTTSAFGTQNAAPAFGAQNTAAAFGQQNTAPAFGQQNTAPAFGGFNAPGTATTVPTLGGFGGFGTTTTTTSAAPTLGGFGNFGATTTTTPSLFGAGGQGFASAGNTGFGGFGGTATTSAAPNFGTFGGGTVTSNAPGGFGGFGTTTTPALGGFGTQGGGFGAFGSGGTAFGSTLGKPVNTVTPGFGGFGGATNFMLGQAQQPPPQISEDEAFAQSISNVSVYGDERDILIAKWNYLQALWGTGKAFYSQSAPPVVITPQNYLCRFKAICYTRLPGKDNKLGFVAINFNKPVGDIKAQQQQIVNTINSILGNRPTFVVNIYALKHLEDKKCQMIIYIEDKSIYKRIPATDLSNYLNQQNWKMQLNSLGVAEILALITPDEDQLKEYLESPPKAIDPRMWNQAILDNPNPKQLIPVPVYGFNDLLTRIKYQENETEMQASYLKTFENKSSEMKLRLAASKSKIAEQKRKVAELTHEILKIIVKQECTRKIGLPLTSEEEALRTKLENMLAVISAPTQFKGRLSELLSQMRMQRSQMVFHPGSEYTMDKDSEEEMKSFLSMQQKAIEAITDTITKDLRALKIITDGLPELVRN